MNDHVDDAPPAGTGPVEVHSPHSATRRAHRLTEKTRRRLIIVLIAAVGLAGAAVGAGMLTGFLPNPVVAGDPRASGRGEPHDNGAHHVKVVRPKRDADFHMTSFIPVAKVEPYYQAGLRARVSGVVRSVSKDIGESVRAGELLVEIDVPDLQQAVEQKAAIIYQREKELAAAVADHSVAKSAIDAAGVAVKLKGVEVDRARDLRAARKFDLDSIQTLAQSNVVLKNKVEAATLDYQAAIRAVEAAEADVEKAKVEQSGKVASLEKAAADVELKHALVEVARKDRDAASIQYGYSRLYAPFDGMIVARSTDPGKYVFGGAGGTSEPLVSVARIDLVTIGARVPDSIAPLVSPTTEALIEFAQLPGVLVRGPITRYSRAIDPTDQTMRVEVDVYNGTQADYRAMLTRAAMKTTVSTILPLDSMAVLAAAGSGLILSKADHKGWHEGAALTPDWGPEGHYSPIVAGSIASMRLELNRFTDTFLLPSGAVYGRAGQSYILVVEDGVTRAIPVAVQVNDGTLVKVAAVVPVGSGRQRMRELTGKEVVVTTRQLEVGEGSRVTPVFEKW